MTHDSLAETVEAMVEVPLLELVAEDQRWKLVFMTFEIAGPVIQVLGELHADGVDAVERMEHVWSISSG